MSPRSDRPALSRQRVISAALDIVDDDGVEGLTMRALGRRLGVDPMAAYHYVPNKSAVLDGVVEAVWTDLTLPEPSDAPWQIQLDEIARSMRATLRRHPNALPVMAARPNLSAPGLRLTDRALGAVHGTGLPPDEALAFVNAAAEFLLGHALAETAPPLAHHDDDVLAAVEAASSSGGLPHLRRTLDQIDLSRVTSDRIFDAGIATLVAGLEKRLADLARTTDAGVTTPSGS